MAQVDYEQIRDWFLDFEALCCAYADEHLEMTDTRIIAESRALLARSYEALMVGCMRAISGLMHRSNCALSNQLLSRAHADLIQAAPLSEGPQSLASRVIVGADPSSRIL